MKNSINHSQLTTYKKGAVFQLAIAIIALVVGGIYFATKNYSGQGPNMVESEKNLEPAITPISYSVKATPIPTSNTKVNPVVTVLSPNGGENIRIGGTYKISWNVTGNLPKGYWTIVAMDNPMGAEVGISSSTATSLNWKIEKYKVTGDLLGDMDTGPHKIYVSIYDSRPCYGFCVDPATAKGKLIASDSSDNYFNIVAAATPVPANLLRVCPRSKISNLMPVAVDVDVPNNNPPSVYFVLDNGGRRELTEFDLDWVSANCIVEEVKVY
ncbi:MAG: hypothetical protein WCT02_00365 [Candidatus Paceibacterota bacterium]